MEKIIYWLEKILKVMAAVIVLDVAAYTYAGIRYGFDHIVWADTIDLYIGYPLMLGSVYAIVHTDEWIAKAKRFFNSRRRKVNLIVMKGGNIEGH